MNFNKRVALISFFSMAPLLLKSQAFLISQIHPSNAEGMAVYAISIRNIARDSILVLHTQEAQFPPFINRYRWEEEQTASSNLLLHLGKSNNPLLPEKYRATKTLASKEQIELYFLVPAKFNGKSKTLDIWYSMLGEKYYADFQKLENANTNSSVKRCKKLKQKYGRVLHKMIGF
jgi:hypothetical protein